jgi:L-asparagine oxygenase
MSIKTPIDTIRLSESEMRALKAHAEGIIYPEHGSYETFLLLARDAVERALSDRTKARLYRLAQQENWHGVVLIDNLPYDARVARGLVDPEVAMAAKPTDLSEVILAGIVCLVGEPYAILQEGKGLISHLSPKRGQLRADTGIGAINELSEHIENAAARCLPGNRAPDGLALIGVSRERDASPGTLVADGRLALSMQPERAQRILRDPTRFLIRFPMRWRSIGFPESLQTAIAVGPEAHPAFVAAFYGGLTEARDLEAMRVLERFNQTLRAVSVDLFVEPGQLVLINNTYQFHGRRAFNPAFDTKGRPYRLVQRLFWISSLDRFGDWPRTRGRLIGPKA